jgi:hypothetical protein
MFKQLVPLNREKHENLKIRPIEDYGFSREVHLSTLMIQEFANAVSIYPIVFIEDNERDSFIPVALMGFAPGENLFVKDDGTWDAGYIPALIRRYPFGLARTTDEGVFSVCFDEKCAAVNAQEGQPLFVDGAEPSPLVEQAKRFLLEVQQMERTTVEFCNVLRDKNLFVPLNMRVQDFGAVRNVTGCYVVNEQRLGALSNDSFLDLRRRNFLPAIYTHLNSLAQIERLVRLRSERIRAMNPLN